MIVAFLFIIYAGLSFALFEAVSRKIIEWHPQVEKNTAVAQARGRPASDISPTNAITR
jgi:hypothetical protein